MHHLWPSSKEKPSSRASCLRSQWSVTPSSVCLGLRRWFLNLTLSCYNPKDSDEKRLLDAMLLGVARSMRKQALEYAAWLTHEEVRIARRTTANKLLTMIEGHEPCRNDTTPGRCRLQLAGSQRR
jgi:hypothetical protein